MDEVTPSFAEWPTSTNILVAHATLMVITWVFLMPIVLVLSVTRSRHALLGRFLFFILNAIGSIQGTYYTHSTPKLYPHEVHGGLGWTIVGLLGVQATSACLSYGYLFIVSVYRNYQSGKFKLGQFNGSSIGRLLTPHTLREDMPEILSQGSQLQLERLLSTSGDSDSEQQEDQFTEYPERTQTLLSKITNFARKFFSGRGFVELSFYLPVLASFFLPIFGFALISSGFSVYVGAYQGEQLSTGLAHMTSGGACYFYGLFTFARWAGCFRSLGWAWNMPITPGDVGPSAQRSRYVSVELLENAMILAAGISYMLFGYTEGWIGRWSGMDLGRLSISISCFGAGICGILFENAEARQRLWTRASHGHHIQGGSNNPVPALTMIILGLSIAFRTGDVNSSLYTQSGALLAGSGIARLLTYIILAFDSRQFHAARLSSELIVSVCLMVSGLGFFMSAEEVLAILAAADISTSILSGVIVAGAMFSAAWTMTLVLLMRSIAPEI